MEPYKTKDINLMEKSVREKEVQDENNTDSDVDSQTEILRAAGIGIAKDDPTEPVLTLRIIYVRLGADVLTEQQMFYGYKAGWGFQILITFSTFLIGFCLAGIFRSIVVVPQELIWPGVLGVTALTTTLHHVHQEQVQVRYDTWKMSRYAFFAMAFCISFCWYWFPDFIFPALSYFSFPCWIKPESKVVNQIFGMSSGMGLLPITFDWSQVSYVGSPLLIPSWAVLNVFISLVFWIWIVAVALYYTNVWNTGYLPFQSSQVFDNTGKTYKVKQIVNAASGYKLDVKKYLAYSPVYMPVTYALNMFGLSFATLSALLVWVILERRHVMADAAKRVPRLVFESLPGRSRAYSEDERGDPDVPLWWYLVACVLALFMSIFAVEWWNVELRWYGVLLACAVALVFYPPLALVYATSNLKINIDIFCRIVAGFVFEGKVLANIWFFDIGYITTIKVGPRRYFSNQIGYSALLYFFIIGAILPIPVYYMTRRYPNSLWRRIHVPLFLGGLNYLPPATGMNYGSWAAVGLTFGWLVRKRLHGWWSKYNFVLSSAMDSSVGIAGALIFLTIYFTGASEHFKWWGTEVHKNTCDWKGCADLSIPKGQKFGM
ncbi:Oligopeptide transporter OPT superfamily [Penicillium expansum]|uniref:Oligopeptide transporter OPT superfamily n=1 Tax=Penicillium expansum TaxID=27334 RepID=A0A0A2K684_PENEN|nr:Oligopeptide transporter OPT superfamily [Penicillium expansum]KGO59642.1 Oligopeptide transporter OPT superfamily [Penicillium expansum]KGO63372.1 Oligopeptide transporter OPT superfamily [Penicillium expansum]